MLASLVQVGALISKIQFDIEGCPESTVRELKIICLAIGNVTVYKKHGF